MGSDIRKPIRTTSQISTNTFKFKMNFIALISVTLSCLVISSLSCDLCDSDGVPLTRASGIVGTSNVIQGEAECKCSSFSRGLRGNCQSKYKGYYWCYLEENKHEGCADFTKSK